MVPWRLCMVAALCSSACCVAQPAQPIALTKWYPGHYLTLALTQKAERWAQIKDQPSFAGGQRIVTWRQLEPEAGRYDFTAIEADLAYLRAQRQRLVLEVWDNSFDGRLMPVPDYLLTPEYGGGIAREARGQEPPRVVRTKRWLPRVMDRYLLLLAALGQRFDADPDFAGFVHTETAMSGKGPGFEDFDAAAYDAQMRRLVVASRQALPRTPVIEYGNWYPYRGSQGLTDLAKLAREQGVGWGGPDLLPGNTIWGYPILRANAGQMPLALSAQWASYDGKSTAQQLLDLAIGEMKLNFVFWGDFNRRGTGGLSFAQDVLPTVSASTATLVLARPANLDAVP